MPLTELADLRSACLEAMRAKCDPGWNEGDRLHPELRSGTRPMTLEELHHLHLSLCVEMTCAAHEERQKSATAVLGEIIEELDDIIEDHDEGPASEVAIALRDRCQQILEGL